MKTTSSITVRIPQGPNSYALIVRPGEFFTPVTSAGIRSGDILVAGTDTLRIVGRVTAVATIDGAQVVELEAVAPDCVIDSFGATLGESLPDECNTGVAPSGFFHTVDGDDSGADIIITQNPSPAVTGPQTMIIKNDPCSAPAVARSYQRQCKDALAYIESLWRAKPAIERYKHAREMAADYLRFMRGRKLYGGGAALRAKWQEQKMGYLARQMRGF